VSIFVNDRSALFCCSAARRRADRCIGGTIMNIWIRLPALAFLAFISASPLAAQPAGPSGFGMMGPGMMGWPSMGRALCDPRAAGLAEWRIETIERQVQPTDAQRPLLDQLKAASTKAAETIAAACPRELPNSPVGRLEVMEKRLTAMLEGVKTVRPAFEAFYASLSDDQKARLARVGPRRWGWRGWHWPWTQ
jgi:LTXXQ motif family protein